MKFVIACALLALCAFSSIEAKPWGKYIQVNVNKTYDGPNFADVLSRLVRQKMDFKNNLWNAFMNAKSQSYNYNYSYNKQPYTKTVSINYGPSKTNDNDKEVEVTTPPPIPQKVAPLVEHEKTFEFNAQSTFSSSSSSSAGSSSGATGRSSAGSNSDSDLVDIADHQKDNN